MEIWRETGGCVCVCEGAPYLVGSEAVKKTCHEMRVEEEEKQEEGGGR